MRFLLALSLVSVALAGCLSSSDDIPDGTDSNYAADLSRWHLDAIFGVGVDPSMIDFQDMSSPHLELHDHTNRSHHVGLTTPNFEVLGWNAMESEHHGANPGGYFCGETGQAGDRKLAVVNSFSSAVALAVVDITDPNAPEMVGELVLPNTQIYDSAMTKDGRYAILATTPLAPIIHTDGSQPDPNDPATHADGTYPIIPEMRTACGTFQGSTYDETPYESGTMLVDLVDPENPQIADFVPGPAIGPHSVSSSTVDGVRYAAASITNLQYDSSYFQFFTVDDTPDGSGKLVPYSEYTAQYAAGQGDYYSENSPNNPQTDPTSGDVIGVFENATDDALYYSTEYALLNGHVDATIYGHPVTGQLLAGLANWDGGMITIDISNPAAPLPVSVWGDKTDTSISHGGVIHSVYPVPEMRNGKFYVITGQEVGGSFSSEIHRPTGQVILIDMTDPENPEPVARWTLPMQLHWSGDLRFSTHYMAVVEDTLFVALYHGGVWAVDMHESKWPELPSMGVFVPDRDIGHEPASKDSHTPNVLDVLVLDNGQLLSFDAESGAYVLSFQRESGVPAMAPWTEDAWI